MNAIGFGPVGAPVAAKDDATVTYVKPKTRATMAMVVTANPSVFSNPGEVITFTYRVANTGNANINTFEITDPKVSPGAPVGNCDRVGIGIGQTATCTATYTTKAVDIGSNIVAPSEVTRNVVTS